MQLSLLKFLNSHISSFILLISKLNCRHSFEIMMNSWCHKFQNKTNHILRMTLFRLVRYLGVNIDFKNQKLFKGSKLIIYDKVLVLYSFNFYLKINI